MSKNTNHTPTPWILQIPASPAGEAGLVMGVFGNGGMSRGDERLPFVGELEGWRDQDQEFAIRAVNAHDALVGALDRILCAHRSGNNGAVSGEATLCESFALQAEHALSKAGWKRPKWFPKEEAAK